MSTLFLFILAACLPQTDDANAQGSGKEQAQSAPQVLRTTPADGDVIPPGLTWIEVEFDQDMDTRGFSFTGNPSQFPPIVGQPEWSGERTARFQAQLEPDRAYLYGVNGGRYQNFRSASGVPAQETVVRFRTSSAEATGPADASATGAADALITLLQTQYSYRAMRPVDYNSLESLLRAELSTQSDACAFAERAAEVLGELDDPHLWVACPSQTFTSSAPLPPPNMDLDAVRARSTDWETLSPAVSIARIDEYGYLLVSSWANEMEGTEAAIDLAVEKLAQYEAGILIDVRPNSGGNELLARGLAGHLVSADTPYATQKALGSQEVGTRTLQASKPHLSMPVALLQGPSNMSSNEAFLLMMQQTQARSFGGRSAGSSGNPKEHPLPNGASVFLPSWQAMTLDGELIEGRGIDPDVFVAWEGEGDPVLEAAIAWLDAQ